MAILDYRFLASFCVCGNDLYRKALPNNSHKVFVHLIRCLEYINIQFNIQTNQALMLEILTGYVRKAMKVLICFVYIMRQL